MDQTGGVDKTTTHSLADAVCGLLLAMLSLSVFFMSDSIQTFGDDPLGPRALPKIVAIAIFFLSLVLMATSVRLLHRGGVAFGNIRIPQSFIRIVLPLWVLLFVYNILFGWFGYLVSTILITVPVLFTFGNRGTFKLAIISIATGILYYLIFIVGFGMYDVSGTFIDFNEFF